MRKHVRILAIVLGDIAQKGHSLRDIGNSGESVLEGLVIGVPQDQEPEGLLVDLTILELFVDGELIRSFKVGPAIFISRVPCKTFGIHRALRL